MPPWLRDGTITTPTSCDDDCARPGPLQTAYGLCRDPDPLVIRGESGEIAVEVVRTGRAWRVEIIGSATLTAGEMAMVTAAMTVKARQADERNRREAE